MYKTQMSPAEATDTQSQTEMQAVLEYLRGRVEAVREHGDNCLWPLSSGRQQKQIQLYCIKRDEPYSCPTCQHTSVEATHLVWLRTSSSGSCCVVDVERRVRYHDQQGYTPSGGANNVGADALLGLAIAPADLLKGFVAHFKCRSAGLRATADRCMLVNGGALMLFPHLISVKDAT